MAQITQIFNVGQLTNACLLTEREIPTIANVFSHPHLFVILLSILACMMLLIDSPYLRNP